MLNDRVRLAFGARRIRNAYQTVFSGIYGPVVLAHIADTCGATETTADSDPVTMAVAEGRRQVWLVIQEVLRMSESDIRDMQERVAQSGENGDE